VQVGDLVYAPYDRKRGFDVVGLVLATDNYEGVKSQEHFKILWSSPSSPIGWWRRDQLKVYCERR